VRRWLRPVRARGRGSNHAVAEADPVRQAAEDAEREGELLDAARRWLEASRLDPERASTHRALARVAANLGWFGMASNRDGRVVTVAAVSASGPDEDLTARPLTVARDAIERACELRPDSVAWLGPLAELREADGDLDGASVAWDAAVAGTEGAPSAWVLRSRHLWQFHQERVHHRRGRRRVDDPLFDVEVVPEPWTAAEGPGVFRVRVTHQGLNIGGWVADPRPRTLEVVLDGEVIRTVNVGSGPRARPFDLVLSRPVVSCLPARARLAVRTPGGDVLLAGGLGAGATVSVPHGDGSLLARLADGARIDKKGGLQTDAREVARSQQLHLELYERVRAELVRLDRDLFVLYGTLLGLHREGDFIPGDDDFDCGYVTGAADPAGAKANALTVIEALVRAGFTVSYNRRGRLFRVHHDAVGDPNLHLDVHPIWFEGADLYVHNHHRFPATTDDLLPAETRRLRGHDVLVPRRPEVLLERFYGRGWRTPDPGYVDDASGTDPEVMARLNEALLTPAEHRELEARLADPARRTAQQGRLVSIAAQSLYPLDGFIE
jgi:hypothetical protein